MIVMPPPWSELPSQLSNIWWILTTMDLTLWSKFSTKFWLKDLLLCSEFTNDFFPELYLEMDLQLLRADIWRTWEELKAQWLWKLAATVLLLPMEKQSTPHMWLMNSDSTQLDLTCLSLHPCLLSSSRHTGKLELLCKFTDSIVQT